jgi:hypothetical protein
MKLTDKIKKEIKRVVWDYAVDDSTLCDIFEGKQSTFSLNQNKLYARLLVSTGWYKLLDCFGQDGLREMLSDDVINLIWIKDIRDRLFYAKEALHGLS